MTTPATLVLADGTIFKGVAIGKEGQTIGRVIFNTAMIGYEAILTDPATAGSLVAFTYPHIGNSGMNNVDAESDRVQVAGLIIRDLPLLASNFRSISGLEEALRRQGIIGIAGIDTRRLTRHLRTHGTQMGAIVSGDMNDSHKVVADIAAAIKVEETTNWVQKVSCDAPYEWMEGQWHLGLGVERIKPSENAPHVVVLDFGVKRNQLRDLVEKGFRVTVVPANSRVDTILALKPAGVFLSSGPSHQAPSLALIDPLLIETVQALLTREIPLFAIGFGYQLLGLALGAKIQPLRVGHHGVNHPVKSLISGDIMMTPQCQDAVIAPENLPESITVTHRSLLDGSIQGIRLDRENRVSVYGFQASPEGDANGLFDDFITALTTK